MGSRLMSGAMVGWLTFFAAVGVGHASPEDTRMAPVEVHTPNLVVSPMPTNTTDTQRPVLVQGDETVEQPAVGQVTFYSGHHLSWSCTATLVAESVIVLADHCLRVIPRGTSAPQTYEWATFEITLPLADSPMAEPAISYHVYRVGGHMSVGTGLGPRDISLMHLTRPVPNSIAQPIPLAETEPEAGAGGEVYGYGCRGRTHGGPCLGTAAKRRFSFRVGERTAVLAEGDSGGPFIVNEHVVSINSAYDPGNGDVDIMASVSPHFTALNAQILVWRQEDQRLMGITPATPSTTAPVTAPPGQVASPASPAASNEPTGPASH